VKSKPDLPGAKRDQRFDTLRGLLLVCMTVNHLPTELRTVTDQSLGLFSSAEGFVFLSGLLAGWVYTRKLWSGGPAGLLSASLGRAKTIYFWHIAAFVTALVSVHLTQRLLGISSPAVPRLFLEHPLAALGLGVALLHQPGLLDLLPMYCAFVLLLPWVIRALDSGRRVLVLSLSAAVWLAAQVLPSVDPALLYPLNTGSFNLFAWQFIFVAGIAIGHERVCGRQQVGRPSPWVLAVAGAVVVYGLGIRYLQWTSLWPDSLYGIFLNKPALGLLRMADFGCVAYFVGILGARLPRALDWRPLAFLGRHSIAVVAAQSVVVMTLLQFDGLFATAAARTLTALVTVGFLFAAAWLSESWKGYRAGTAEAIGARQASRTPLVRADGTRAARAAGTVHPGDRQPEGDLPANALYPKPAPGKRRRALVASLSGSDRPRRARERAAH